MAAELDMNSKEPAEEDNFAPNARGRSESPGACNLNSWYAYEAGDS